MHAAPVPHLSVQVLTHQQASGRRTISLPPDCQAPAMPHREPDSALMASCGLLEVLRPAHFNSGSSGASVQVH